jgi:hypothetical protein
MVYQSKPQLEAVMVFAQGQLDRQMQYPEFEAVMDGFVPMQEFSSAQAQAVYLCINADLCITASVFFYIDFDAQGMVAKHWNVPLQQLAETASRGPDLGAGPIALACYSQCPLKWQKNKLWDPIMEPGRNSFVLMKKAVAGNTLGLIFPEPVAQVRHSDQPAGAELATSELKAELEQQYARAMRNRLANTLKKQRLHINTVRSRMAIQLNELKQAHHARLEQYQQELDQHAKSRAQLEQDNQQLQQQLAMQHSKVQGLREYYENKLADFDNAQGAAQTTQVEALEQRLTMQFEESQAQLQEQLDMRDMELSYRRQQAAAARGELEQLRAEHEQLLNQGASRLLTPLQKAGISFVVFAPGVGQTTLAPSSVGAFMADPEAYFASLCGVSLQHYKRWLDHTHSPYCNAINEQGEECGVGVRRVLQPTDFHDGESNRCAEHLQLAPSVAQHQG